VRERRWIVGLACPVARPGHYVRALRSHERLAQVLNLEGGTAAGCAICRETAFH